MFTPSSQASDPIASLWRPLESTELPLHLHFNATSSTPTTPTDTHPYFSNTANNHDTGQAPARSLYGSTLRHAFGTTQHPTLTLDIPQQHDIGNSSSRPASFRTEPRRILERHEAIREMLDASEPTAPIGPPITSSLSNWNGRSHMTNNASGTPRGDVWRRVRKGGINSCGRATNGPSPTPSAGPLVLPEPAWVGYLIGRGEYVRGSTADGPSGATADAYVDD